MEKDVTNIKDLVIHALSNGSEIKAKAESGDALACFQMGMIHLLGINTQIDFKKARAFFENQSLLDDSNANLLLGFIAECEGDYSDAFQKYANASKAKKPYINKVYEERRNQQSYFNKLNLPKTILNKEISGVLDEYNNGGSSNLDTIIKIAYICEDEQTSLEVAKALAAKGNLFSAKSWLQKGKVDTRNPSYISIEKKLIELKTGINLPDIYDVVEINGNSLISDFELSHSYEGIKKKCDKVAASSKKEWHDIISPVISSLKKQIEEEEAARIKKEQDAEAARLKKQQDAEAARLKKQQDAEAARLKKQQEEEDARLKMQQEEQKKLDREKAMKNQKGCLLSLKIGLILLFIPIVVLLIYTFATTESSGNILINIIVWIFFLNVMVVLPFFVLWWIGKKIINKIYK